MAAQFAAALALAVLACAWALVFVGVPTDPGPRGAAVEQLARLMVCLLTIGVAAFLVVGLLGS